MNPQPPLYILKNLPIELHDFLEQRFNKIFFYADWEKALNIQLDLEGSILLQIQIRKKLQDPGTSTTAWEYPFTSRDYHLRLYQYFPYLLNKVVFPLEGARRRSLEGVNSVINFGLMVMLVIVSVHFSFLMAFKWIN